MGSSSKKKKRRRADFQKVKLKLGRKIPKSLNETKTSFKSKKIQIRNQLAITNDQPAGSKPKTTLEEFFHGIRNTNFSSRRDALIRFKELFNSFPELVFIKLNDVIIQLAKLMEDKAGEIRIIVYGVLKKVLLTISKDQLYPNFPTIIGYLNCAMTNIDSDIQKDSLDFLEFLTEHFSQYLVSSHMNILSNFLEQVSHQGESKKFNSFQTIAAKRTLTVNPNSKVTAEAWRFRVFQRLQKFLKTLVKNLTEADYCCEPMKEIKWKSSSQLYISPNPIPDSSYACQDFYYVKSSGVNVNKVENANNLQSFISSIVPLLFETWIELRPSNKSEGLSAHLLRYLYCLMEILNTVVEYINYIDRLKDEEIMRRWFQKMFEADFVHHIVQDFPYILDDTISSNIGRRKNSITDVPLQVTCHNLNLFICHIYFQMALDVKPDNENIWEKLMSFISELLTAELHPNSNFNLTIIISLLKEVFKNNKLEKIRTSLIVSLFSYYYQTKPGSSNRRHLEKFFSQYMMHIHEDKTISCSSEFTTWIMSLPKEVHMHEITWEMIDILKKLAPLNNEAFLSVLRKEISSIIDKMPTVELPNFENSRIQRALIELLIWVPHLDVSDFLVLSRFLKKDSITIEIQQYCLQLLSNRYRLNIQRWQQEAPVYISFLLHVLLDIHSSELSTLKSENTYKLSLHVTVERSQHGQIWSKQRQIIIKEICNSFNFFENIEQIQYLISTFLDKLLTKYSVLPLSSAWSVFELLCNLQPMDNFWFIKSVISSLASLAVSALITECIHAVTPPENIYKILFSNVKLANEVFQLLAQIVQGIQAADEAVFLCQVILKFGQAKRFSVFEAIFLKKSFHRIHELFGSSVEELEIWHLLQYELEIRLSSKDDYI